MAQTAGEHGNSVYLRTWLWLFVITLVEVGITLVHLPRGLLVTLLVALAIMKVLLIAGYFMHLRFERLSLVYMVLTPVILIVALVVGIWPDAVRIAS